MKSALAAICLSFVTQVAFAQSPYAGMQTRSIKALSEQRSPTSRLDAGWVWRFPLS
jgi:hypothetical protein